LRILFLSDNFPPEVNAPATRTYEHCKEWVSQGVEVTVLTCAPNFPKGVLFDGYKNRIKQIEYLDGIKVVRVWSFMAANQGFFKRTIDYLSFSISSFIAGLFIKTDIIIATSPQFFTAISGRKLSFWKRTPWIMEVRDLWPESIKNVGAMKENFLYKLLEKQEKKCYKSAKVIVTAVNFKKEISAKGIDGSKIKVIKNGANLNLFKTIPKPESLVDKLELNDKFVIGYVGTHGLAHKLDFILKAAKKINDTSIHLVFIGDGAEKQNLLKLAEKLNLNNVTFLSSVMKSNVVEYLALMDVALIPLKRSDLFKNALPSKIFESAAMERPILLGVDGEARKLIEDYQAGLFFEPENEQSFLEAINKLTNDTVFYIQCQKGCRQLAIDFDRKKLALEMLEFVKLQLR